MQKDDDTQFPVKVDSPFITFVQKLILFSIKCLAFVMSLVILWSVIDVTVVLVKKAMEPPYLLISIDQLLNTFGEILIVLIALEIFLNIVLYLRRDGGHVRLVLATALMAISRKIIILDYDHTDSFKLLGMGLVIIALGVTYWLTSLQQDSPSEKILPR